MQRVERLGSQLSPSEFKSRHRYQNGVVAERHRHLIVDQDYASSNLVDPALFLNAGVAERTEALLF